MDKPLVRHIVNPGSIPSILCSLPAKIAHLFLPRGAQGTPWSGKPQRWVKKHELSLSILAGPWKQLSGTCDGVSYPMAALSLVGSSGETSKAALDSTVNPALLDSKVVLLMRPLEFSELVLTLWPHQWLVSAETTNSFQERPNSHRSGLPRNQTNN